MVRAGTAGNQEGGGITEKIKAKKTAKEGGFKVKIAGCVVVGKG